MECAFPMTRIRRLFDEQVARRDLWLSLAIGLTFGIYHVVTAITWTGSMDVYKTYSLFSTFLTVIIFSLLWVAYRRWREAEQHRRELDAIMRSLSTEAILLVDPSRRILSSSEAVSRLFGRRAEDLVGLLTDSLYDDRRLDKNCPDEIRHQLETVGSHLGMAAGRRLDGSTFDLEIITERFKGRTGAVLVLRDVTERLRSEKALLVAKMEAENAYDKLKDMEKMRDSLTHMIIHDMRTPLAVIQGMSEMLMEDLKASANPAEIHAMLMDLKGQAQILSQLTNGVLDVSRLESGRMPLNKRVIDVGSLAGAVCDSLGTILRRHKLVQESDEEPVRAECDSDIIGRVVANLLSNSRKYTPEGSTIMVRVKRTTRGAYVAIQDTGPGIPFEQQARIFEKYTQVGDAPSTKYHSAGLGLTFCKLAVESHGGTIGVDSTPGHGATFWFTLPVPGQA